MSIITKMQSNSQSTQPWIEKYRPTNINNIIGQECIVNCIMNLLQNNHLPNLLFSGAQSTGKTTLAHCITNFIYKNDMMSVLELNASDDRGIDTVRDLIFNFSNTKNFINNIKIVILDEIDAMTHEAQLLLNNIIDNSIKNCRFIFICNYINKIAPTIQSRCVHIVFKNLPINYLSKCIDIISVAEKLKIENNIDLIKLSNYDIRKIYNTLQMLKYYDNNITTNLIRNFINIPKKEIIIEIYEILLNKKLSISEKFDKINNFIYIYSFQLFLTELSNYLIEIKNYNNIKLLADIEIKLLVINNININLLYLITNFH